MLDIVGLIYFTISTLSLLGLFPIGIYEFFDLAEGLAISDYGALFETSTYFSISAIITGLLCGLDSITNPIYKKSKKLLYNYHALASFTLVGIGLFPLTGEIGWSLGRVVHWIFANAFIFVYPITRLLILKDYNRKVFRNLLIFFISLNISGITIAILLDFKDLTYPEYLMWISLLATIVISKITIERHSQKALI